MKQVEFEQIKSVPVGYGMGKGMRYRFEEAELIIRRRIQAGWEFEGFVPLETRATGDVETYALVFVQEQE